MMDPVTHLISDENALEFDNEAVNKKVLVVRKTPLKSRNHQKRKPRRRVCQHVPKHSVGDTCDNFITSNNKNERERNTKNSGNGEFTFTFPTDDAGKKCIEVPEVMFQNLQNSFKSSDKQNIPETSEVYYDSCDSIDSNCVENDCEWTVGDKSQGVDASDKSDNKRTSCIETSDKKPTSLQDSIDNQKESPLPCRIINQCLQEDSSVLNKTKQLQVVKIEIPLEIAECMVNIIYSEASKGVLLDRGFRNSVFVVMDLILIEVAKYELLEDKWCTEEDYSSSIDTSQQKVVKIEIPLEIAKQAVNICYSESSKGVLSDSSLKGPVFLVTNLILDKVAKCHLFGDDRCTVKNSSGSTQMRQNEMVNIKIPLEMGKCVMDIFQFESSERALLLHCSLFTRPVFLVMEVISNEVSKCFNDERALLKSSSRMTDTKQRGVIKIKIPLVIAKCAVNSFYSELSNWDLFEPDHRPMFEVMSLIQNKLSKYVDDESVYHTKLFTIEEKRNILHSRECNDFEELSIKAEECADNLYDILAFLENVDPVVAQRRQKRRLYAQELEDNLSGGSFPTFVANILLVFSIIAALVFPALRSMYVESGLTNGDNPFLSFFGCNESAAASDVDVGTANVGQCIRTLFQPSCF